MQKVKGRSGNTRRGSILLGLIIAVGVVPFLLYARGPGQPEKLRPYPFEKISLSDGSRASPYFWKVHKGNLALVFQSIENQSGDVLITSEPLAGGTRRTISTVKPSPGTQLSIGEDWIEDEGVWIFEQKRELVPLKATAGSVSAVAPGYANIPTSDFRRFTGVEESAQPTDSNNLGTFLLPEKLTPQKAEDELRWEIIPTSPPLYPGAQKPTPIRPVFVSWDGKERRGGMTPPRRNIGTVSGDMAFWCESSAKRLGHFSTPADATPGTRRRANLIESATTLYALSPDGKAARAIATGLADPEFLSTYLLDCDGGVAVLQPRPYPDPRRDLLIYREPDYLPIRIADYRSAVAPVLAAERFWWVERGRPNVEISESTLYLLSVRQDGSDLRRVSFSIDSQGRSLQAHRLLAHANRLFLVYKLRSEKRSADWMPRLETRFGAIQSESSPTVETFFTTSDQVGQFQLEGDSLYFVKTDAQHNPLDFLSDRNTLKFQSFLYRIKLPD